MEKGKNLFFSSDSLSPFPTIKPGTISYWVANVNTLIDDINSSLFLIAKLNFEKFLTEEFKTSLEIGEDQIFLDELFELINFKQQSQNVISTLNS